MSRTTRLSRNRSLAVVNPVQHKPTLIVTVDTEEEGLWGPEFRAKGNTVANLRGATRFQQLCDEFSITPTYLVDTPVVEDKRVAGILREYQDAGRAEIGAHLHPWCTPPFVEELNSVNSFMCNLPESLQEEKLKNLTAGIEAQFGRRPTSFRAGRYGLDMVGARILGRLGYRVDSSVIPFNSFVSESGPDFASAPVHPYFLDGTDICRPHDAGVLLEIPVSYGFNRTDFRWAQRVLNTAMKPVFRRLRAVGILDRLGIVRRIKFSPEQAGARAMKRLVDIYRRQGIPCLVMMMHSSSFSVGYSPYCSTEERLERFYSDMRSVFDYCVNRCQLPTRSLSGFAASYQQTVIG